MITVSNRKKLFLAKQFQMQVYHNYEISLKWQKILQSKHIKDEKYIYKKSCRFINCRKTACSKKHLPLKICCFNILNIVLKILKQFFWVTMHKSNINKVD